MTAKAALAMALLRGRIVNIKNGFHLFGITNVPREIGRSIEGDFGVEVERTRREGTSQWGQSCIWFDYRLVRTDRNREGIEKMKKYVAEQSNGGKAFVKKPSPVTQANLGF